jgi:hypothetical protein
MSRCKFITGICQNNEIIEGIETRNRWSKFYVSFYKHGAMVKREYYLELFFSEVYCQKLKKVKKGQAEGLKGSADNE